MLMLHPLPTCPGAGPDLCTLRPDLITLCPDLCTLCLCYSSMNPELTIVSVKLMDFITVHFFGCFQSFGVP